MTIAKLIECALRSEADVDERLDAVGAREHGRAVAPHRLIASEGLERKERLVRVEMDLSTSGKLREK